MFSLFHLQRPLQCHLGEGVEVDFGVYESRLQMPMPEHVSNRFEGIAFLKHSGRKAVAKNMCSLIWYVDTCRQDTAPDYSGDQAMIG